MENNSHKYISSATTTVCKTGSGQLKRITITESVASVITVYDNTAGSGTVLTAFKASAAEQSYEFQIPFHIGLTVVTAGSSKLNVVFE